MIESCRRPWPSHSRSLFAQCRPPTAADTRTPLITGPRHGLTHRLSHVAFRSQERQGNGSSTKEVLGLDSPYGKRHVPGVQDGSTDMTRGRHTRWPNTLLGKPFLMGITTTNPWPSDDGTRCPGCSSDSWRYTGHGRTVRISGCHSRQAYARWHARSSPLPFRRPLVVRWRGKGRRRRYRRFRPVAGSS